MKLKFLIYILNLPLFYLSCIVPKKKNLWIFGSWFGEKYTDNTKYFYEYVIGNKKEIRAVWLSKNKSIVDELKLRNYEAYLTYSLKGYIISLMAEKSFCTVSHGDLNLFVPAKKVINMWHGAPLKKIGYDDKMLVSPNLLIKNVRKIIFPFIKPLESYNCLLSSSEEEQINMATAFGKKKSDVLVTGLPRNVSLKKSNEVSKNNNICRILYLPTHRQEGVTDSVYDNIIRGSSFINNFLEAHPNVQFDVKMHFYHEKAYLFNCLHKNFNNIGDSVIDLYEVLGDYDILITDYSSVFFDFLLTNKPIIFFPFDIEDYLEKDRELYFDYEDAAPGPKCMTWIEVFNSVKSILEESDKYAELRAKCKKRFHIFEGNEIMEQVFNRVAER